MGSCCNSRENSEIKISQCNSNPRIRLSKDEDNNSNFIKIKIITNGGNPITMNVKQKSLFSEVKKKYCLLARKNENDLIIFVHKGKTIEENESLYSLGINEGITIAAFDSNDYKLWIDLNKSCIKFFASNAINKIYGVSKNSEYFLFFNILY